jgi:GH18 family chitinase
MSASTSLEPPKDLFIPYENPSSIKEKVRFSAAQGLGGVMIKVLPRR